MTTADITLAVYFTFTTAFNAGDLLAMARQGKSIRLRIASIDALVLAAILVTADFSYVRYCVAAILVQMAMIEAYKP